MCAENKREWGRERSTAAAAAADRMHVVGNRIRLHLACSAAHAVAVPVTTVMRSGRGNVEPGTCLENSLDDDRWMG